MREQEKCRTFGCPDPATHQLTLYYMDASECTILLCAYHATGLHKERPGRSYLEPLAEETTPAP